MSITVYESLKLHCEALTAKNNHLEDIINILQLTNEAVQERLILRDKFVEKMQADLIAKDNEINKLVEDLEQANDEIENLSNHREDLKEQIKDLKGEI